jgi:hypothetical protein
VHLALPVGLMSGGKDVAGVRGLNSDDTWCRLHVTRAGFGLSRG